MNKKENFKRMCSFYVSDIHLSTMLLPYIKNKIAKGDSWITFLDHDIEKEMKLLLSKVNLDNNIKEKISQINWKKNWEYKYSKIEEILEKEINEKTENNILIIGKGNEIEQLNQSIEKFIEKANVSFSIINCYYMEEEKIKIDEILKKHDKIINTLGEKNIEEILGECKKEKRKLENNC